MHLHLVQYIHSSILCGVLLLTTDETSATETSQPMPTEEVVSEESLQESMPVDGVALAHREFENSTITIEELAPATANIANALVCEGIYYAC